MSSAMASESSNARTNSGKKMSDCAFSRAHMALADRPTFVPIFQNRAMECQALYLDLVRGSPVNRGMRNLRSKLTFSQQYQKKHKSELPWEPTLVEEVSIEEEDEQIPFDDFEDANFMNSKYPYALFVNDRVF
ncbi:hypothetical protein V6N12_024081 [Hibiscus sabdariffa]|uniref:Uncharacterized protein n=1 Tax=Hibiscus sabdariffa TaxID=183260 RepID=A0ABR2FZK1_9ROSI